MPFIYYGGLEGFLAGYNSIIVQENYGIITSEKPPPPHPTPTEIMKSTSIRKVHYEGYSRIKILTFSQHTKKILIFSIPDPHLVSVCDFRFRRAEINKKS
jgi:hypothetical protein